MSHEKPATSSDMGCIAVLLLGLLWTSCVSCSTLQAIHSDLQRIEAVGK